MEPKPAEAVAAIAAGLLRARRAGTAYRAPDGLSLSREDALAAQQAVSAALGPVGGFKVGAHDGDPLVIAPICADHLWPSGADIPAGGAMGVELEVGFTLIAPLTPETAHSPALSFRPRVALELVRTRLAPAHDDDRLLKLADMQINHGLVLGPLVEDWDGDDFTEVAARQICGAHTVLDGPATVPGGSALANLAALCARLGRHCGGLRVGQTVITGSISGLGYHRAPCAVLGEIAGLGAVRCRLT